MLSKADVHANFHTILYLQTFLEVSRLRGSAVGSPPAPCPSPHDRCTPVRHDGGGQAALLVWTVALAVSSVHGGGH